MPKRIQDSDMCGGLVFRSAHRAHEGRDFRKANNCFGQLLADKEDVSQVFKIEQAMSGLHCENDLRRRLAGGEGRAQARLAIVPHRITRAPVQPL